MAIRNILKQHEETLRKKSKVVTEFNEKLWQLLDDMKHTMVKNNGIGLAAPQVGVLKRVVVIDLGDGLIELVNPIVVEKQGVQKEVEGCLSCPNEFGTVTRPKFVTVKAQDRKGKEITLKGQDLLARAFCHEIDHLDGILFKDLATDIHTEK